MPPINISIIIPTYNNAGYICAALESVFAQSCNSCEVIVIDDGSTDETRHLLESYLPRIQYIYQKHTGVSAARNRGLTQANGKYVAFLDADDLFLPHKLAKQTAFLDAHEEIGLVHSGWHLIDEHKNVLAKKEPWRRAPNLDLADWLIWQPIFLGAILFRRNWLKKAGPFDTSLSQAEDTDFLLRLAGLGCPAAWLKEPTVYYRQHGTGLTKRSMERVLNVNKVIENFFAAKALPEAARFLENKVRYQILMWSVWQLYRSGNPEKIVDYLHKTLTLVNGSAKHIIHGWLLALIAQCRADHDYDLDELRNFWPYFEQAIQYEDENLAASQRLFFWLLQSETQLISQKIFADPRIQTGVVNDRDGDSPGKFKTINP